MPETCEVIVRDEGFHVKAVKIQFRPKSFIREKLLHASCFKKVFRFLPEHEFFIGYDSSSSVA